MKCVSGNVSSSFLINCFNLAWAMAVILESSGSRSGISRTAAITPFGWLPFDKSSEKK